MTDVQPWIATTCTALADLLASAPAETWAAATLCDRWQVRHVVAHLTMPARLTPEQFGAEMAAAGGDFEVLSTTVAARDGELPPAELLDALRAPALHAYEMPGGGMSGSLSHAVIHSLDITVALDRDPVAPAAATLTVLDQLAGGAGGWFGVDATGVRLEATDADWHAGEGPVLRADAGTLVALLSGRRLPDGRALPRR